MFVVPSLYKCVLGNKYVCSFVCLCVLCCVSLWVCMRACKDVYCSCQFSATGFKHWSSQYDFPFQIVLAIVSFFTVSFGGIFIGIAWGMLASFITRFTDHVRGKLKNFHHEAKKKAKTYFEDSCGQLTLLHYGIGVSTISLGRDNSFANKREEMPPSLNWFFSRTWLGKFWYDTV